MNPEIEFFLESAFEEVQPVSASIGRVVVEPNYDAAIDESEKPTLTAELVACLGQNRGTGEFEPSNAFPVLAKYIRRISLHPDTVEGAWVEVAPPGNWI